MLSTPLHWLVLAAWLLAVLATPTPEHAPTTGP
jgi:hypothetical protein